MYVEIQNALGTAQPSPPSFGLSRDDAGMILQPQQLIQLPEESGSLLPILGFAVDF